MKVTSAELKPTDRQRALVLSRDVQLLHLDEYKATFPVKTVCETTVQECYFNSSLEQPTGIEPILRTLLGSESGQED